MIKINIISIGDIKETFYREALKEYEKRISRFADVTVLKIQEERLPQNPSNSEINKALEKEGKNIIKKMKEGNFSIALALEGKSFSSEEFSQKIEDIIKIGFNGIEFIIGSSYGLSEEVKKKCNERLSFSKMTFPHQLMRVILTEQIYRCFKIMKNETYHK